MQNIKHHLRHENKVNENKVLSYCCHIFLWLCIWCGCTIKFCRLLHIDPGNTVSPHYYDAVYDVCKKSSLNIEHRKRFSCTFGRVSVYDQINSFKNILCNVPGCVFTVKSSSIQFSKRYSKYRSIATWGVQFYVFFLYCLFLTAIPHKFGNHKLTRPEPKATSAI